jgi:hypothetical protein
VPALCDKFQQQWGPWGRDVGVLLVFVLVFVGLTTTTTTTTTIIIIIVIITTNSININNRGSFPLHNLVHHREHIHTLQVRVRLLARVHAPHHDPE